MQHPSLWICTRVAAHLRAAAEPKRVYLLCSLDAFFVMALPHAHGGARTCANHDLVQLAASGKLLSASGKTLSRAQVDSIIFVLQKFPVSLLERDVTRLALSKSCQDSLRALLRAKDSFTLGAAPVAADVAISRPPSSLHADFGARRAGDSAAGTSAAPRQSLGTSGAQLDAVTPEVRQYAALSGCVGRGSELQSPEIAQAVEARLTLVVDTREIRSATDRDFMESHLLQAGVPVQVRQLPLGDFLWVVQTRRRSPAPAAAATDASSPPFSRTAYYAGTAGKAGVDDLDSTVEERVTNFIVERKRASDLASSIVDGRYDEQKRRLVACACAVPVFLVEGALSRQDMLSVTAMRTAMRTTRIGSGMRVVACTTIHNTIEWLAAAHQAIARLMHESAEPCGDGWIRTSLHALARNTRLLPLEGTLTYDAFAAASKKTQPRTTLQLFGSMLRAIPGVSASRAQALLESMPTPSA